MTDGDRTAVHLDAVRMLLCGRPEQPLVGFSILASDRRSPVSFPAPVEYRAVDSPPDVSLVRYRRAVSSLDQKNGRVEKLRQLHRPQLDVDTDGFREELLVASLWFSMSRQL